MKKCYTTLSAVFIILVPNGVLCGTGCFYELTDDEITVDTDAQMNQSIYTLEVTSIRERRGVPNIELIASYSPYFEVIENDMFVRSCLIAGKAETLEISLRDVETNSDIIGCELSLTVTVRPSKPDISLSENVSVFVAFISDDIDAQNSKAVGIDVLDFEIVNEGPCTKFECAATCINDRKEFWVAKGATVIRTSPKYIMFNYNYELQLECQESDIMERIESSVASVNVIFFNETSLTAYFTPTTIILPRTTSTSASEITSKFGATMFMSAALLVLWWMS